jgi:hypothetical protein
VRAEASELAGRCRALASASVVSTAAALPRKASSDPGRKPIHLLGPFRRSRAPERPSQCAMPRLASPTDASLSAPRTWHAGRGTELDVWRAAGEHAARLGTQRSLSEQNRGAAQPSTAGKTAALDHIARKDAAARDTPTNDDPKAVRSHPAPTADFWTRSSRCDEGAVLHRTGDPESPRVAALGLSLFSAGALSNPRAVLRPKSRR